MAVVAGRGRQEAHVDSEAEGGADGPVSCLRNKAADPGRNKGRAAATWPVIANWGGRGEAEAEGRGRVAARREAAGCSLLLGRDAALFNATSGHSLDRGPLEA